MPELANTQAKLLSLQQLTTALDNDPALARLLASLDAPLTLAQQTVVTYYLEKRLKFDALESLLPLAGSAGMTPEIVGQTVGQGDHSPHALIRSWLTAHGFWEYADSFCPTKAKHGNYVEVQTRKRELRMIFDHLCLLVAENNSIPGGDNQKILEFLKHTAPRLHVSAYIGLYWYVAPDGPEGERKESCRRRAFALRVAYRLYCELGPLRLESLGLLLKGDWIKAKTTDDFAYAIEAFKLWATALDQLGVMDEVERYHNAHPDDNHYSDREDEAFPRHCETLLQIALQSATGARCVEAAGMMNRSVWGELASELSELDYHNRPLVIDPNPQVELAGWLLTQGVGIEQIVWILHNVLTRHQDIYHREKTVALLVGFPLFLEALTTEEEKKAVINALLDADDTLDRPLQLIYQCTRLGYDLLQKIVRDCMEHWKPIHQVIHQVDECLVKSRHPGRVSAWLLSLKDIRSFCSRFPLIQRLADELGAMPSLAPATLRDIGHLPTHLGWDLEWLDDYDPQDWLKLIKLEREAAVISNSVLSASFISFTL